MLLDNLDDIVFFLFDDNCVLGQLFFDDDGVGVARRWGAGGA